MAHPYESSREMHPGRKAAESRVKAYAKGGKAYASTPSVAVAKKATGGAVEYKVGGAVSAPRADRFARGGHAKGKHHKGTHINIAVVAPHGKPDMGAAPGGPPGMPPPGLPSGGPPVGVPPGGGAPGGPPGMPGGMMPSGPMKRGGRAYAKGGKVPMKGGGDSGVGRLDKIKAYGAKAKKD